MSCLIRRGNVLDTVASEAVLRIWLSRAEAHARQVAAGRTDAGLRSEVTSGGHLSAVADLIAKQFTDAGIKPNEIWCGRSKLELPGFYRCEKQWDVVVVRDNQLVAAIELKCIGSSYGKNLNNRIEEALGNAVDLAQAIKNNLVGTYAPWLGYVFVIRDDAESSRAVGCKEPHFPIDPAFRDASYQARARILCSRLVQERLYNSAWFVTADPTTGTVTEPDAQMTWAKFKAAIEGKVGEVLA